MRARIGGRRGFDGADLGNPGGNALTADQMVVTEGCSALDLMLSAPSLSRSCGETRPDPAISPYSRI